MAKNDFKLTQTTSKFVLKGQVVGLSNENAFRESTFEQGKNEGKEYKSMRLGVKTSESNTIYAEMFGMELDFVYPYSRDDKKSQKIPFADRHNPPKGYQVIGISMGLKFGKDGKQDRKSMVEFDAIDYIRENLEDGDTVTVSGEIQFSEYKNKNSGELVKQTRYTIKSIYKQKDAIDFNAENFKEVTDFEQELVFVSSEFDKEEGKVHVLGYTIGYADKFQDAVFTIDPKKSADVKKMAETFLKKLKFGDFIKVFGNCVNKVEFVEVEEEQEEDIWGEKPESLDKKAVRNYITELTIIGADGKTYEKAKYSEDDFVKEEQSFEEENVDDADNPFSDSDEDEIDEDDLPF